MRSMVRLQRELLERQMVWFGYWSLRAWQRWLMLADLIEAEVYGEVLDGVSEDE